LALAAIVDGLAGSPSWVAMTSAVETLETYSHL